MSTYNYNNLPIGADEGLHEAVFDRFSEGNFGKNCKIAILASGSGAFDQRLIDHGYQNIKSCDIFPINKSDVSHFETRDLNNDFSDFGSFDVIFAMEIIEHIENTAGFLRSLRKILKPGGIVYLTTPQVEQITSRFYALFRNDIPMFNRGMLKHSGHINPVLDHVFNWHLDNNSLKLVDRSFNRSGISRDDWKRMTIKAKIFSALIKILSKIVPGNDGHISIYSIARA